MHGKAVGHADETDGRPGNDHHAVARLGKAMAADELIDEERQVIEVLGHRRPERGDAVEERHAAHRGGIVGQGDDGNAEPVLGQIAGGTAGLRPDDDEPGVGVLDDAAGTVARAAVRWWVICRSFGGVRASRFWTMYASVCSAISVRT